MTTTQTGEGNPKANGSGLLTRDAILQSVDLQFDVIEVPEWGGSVRIRELRSNEAEQYKQAVVQFSPFVRDGKVEVDVKMNRQNLKALLVSLTAVNAEGEQLFSHKDVIDLGKKSARVLDRVYEASAKLSGLAAESVEAEGKD